MFKLTPNDLSNIGDAVRKLAVTGIMVETFVHCGNEIRLVWEGPAEPYIVDIKARHAAGLAGTNLRQVVVPESVTTSRKPTYQGPSFPPGEDHS